MRPNYSISCTDLTRASTESPCSSFDPSSLLRWGRLCLGHSGTWCGSSALMDTLKLIISVKTHVVAVRCDRNGCSCFWPSLFSFFICAVISSWLFILDSLIFLGVEAWSMSSLRLSMSSELHVRCPLWLITVRLGVLFFQVYPRISYSSQMHADINVFLSTLTVGQTGGLFPIVVSIVFTWISALETPSPRCEVWAVICKAGQHYDVANVLITEEKEKKKKKDILAILNSPSHSQRFGLMCKRDRWHRAVLGTGIFFEPRECCWRHWPCPAAGHRLEQ